MSLDIENLPHHWVNRLSFLLRKELQQLFAQAGENITAEEWAVLLLLWRLDGQTPSNLADQTIRDRTTMTRLLDGIVRKSLVMRATDRSDRRKTRILLTIEGRAKREVLIPIAQGLIERSLVGINPEDIEASLRVMRGMVQNLKSGGTE